eukprot:366082-Chlamydomonas_euryale.AAC.41
MDGRVEVRMVETVRRRPAARAEGSGGNRFRSAVWACTGRLVKAGGDRGRCSGRDKGWRRTQATKVVCVGAHSDGGWDSSDRRRQGSGVCAGAEGEGAPRMSGLG